MSEDEEQEEEEEEGDEEDEEDEEEDEEEKVAPLPAVTVSSLTREIQGMCSKADSVMGQMGSNGYVPYQA